MGVFQPDWDDIEPFNNEEFLKYVNDIFKNTRKHCSINYKHIKQILLASVEYVADNYIDKESQCELNWLKEKDKIWK